MNQRIFLHIITAKKILRYKTIRYELCRTSIWQLGAISDGRAIILTEIDVNNKITPYN
jgi:hypothetical protein